MRGIHAELPDLSALRRLLDQGEQDRELDVVAPTFDLREGEWLTLTIRVGLMHTTVPARGRRPETGRPCVHLSERDWIRLESFSRGVDPERMGGAKSDIVGVAEERQQGMDGALSLYFDLGTVSLERAARAIRAIERSLGYNVAIASTQTLPPGTDAEARHASPIGKVA